jgi:hypothetical protein
MSDSLSTRMQSPLVLGVTFAVVLGGVYALAKPPAIAATPSPAPTRVVTPSASSVSDPTTTSDDSFELESQHGAAIFAGGTAEGLSTGEAAEGFEPTASDEAPALTWTPPPTWPSIANPNAIRIATYRVPRVAPDTIDAELSVSRAGGNVDDNIARWSEQFQGGSPPVRTVQTVHGSAPGSDLTVNVVELSGSYANGMGESGARDGWSMLGAIVQASGEPYFFKLVGPATTVRASKAAWSTMIASFRRI